MADRPETDRDRAGAVRTAWPRRAGRRAAVTTVRRGIGWRGVPRPGRWPVAGSRAPRRHRGGQRPGWRSSRPGAGRARPASDRARDVMIGRSATGGRGDRRAYRPTGRAG